MPELPEVETLRRDLERTLVGRTVQQVALGKEKLFRPSPGLSLDDLVGRRVERLGRRGKLMLWQLSDDLTLVVHLKLAGQLVHLAADGAELAHGGHPVPAWGSPLPHKATHVTFHLDDGSVLYLTDIRQFARLWLMPDAEAEDFVAAQRLGPEPLSDAFTLASLRQKLARRGIPIKTTLLDQGVVGGIGNIYADESLWAARIHPKRPASSLTKPETKRLYEAIRSVLDYAIREGVAFVPQGKAISDRDFPYCHGRAGSPCPRCGKGVIVKEWVGNRGTYWCPICQRERLPLIAVGA